jgi:gliding motility-associated-like protein
MKKIKALLTMALVMTATATWADINPKAYYTDEHGTEVMDSLAVQGEAPLYVRFEANAKDLDAGATLEWRFVHTGAYGTESFVRYEEDTQYTFIEAGVTLVTLIVKYNSAELEDYTTTFSVTISASKLIFPNAFSPNNGDDVNNVFKAKAYESIVEFHAYIFNRWGQKLYDWTDPAGGWDGTYNGKDVNEGVYFLLCNAKGADGTVYTIKKDVNLLRGYTNTTNSY